MLQLVVAIGIILRGLDSVRQILLPHPMVGIAVRVLIGQTAPQLFRAGIVAVFEMCRNITGFSRMNVRHRRVNRRDAAVGFR